MVGARLKRLIDFQMQFAAAYPYITPADFDLSRDWLKSVVKSSGIGYTTLVTHTQRKRLEIVYAAECL
jgi:hypothetical protein